MERREILDQWFGGSSDLCDVADLTELPLQTAAALLAITRTAGDDDLRILRPLIEWPGTVTPGGAGDLDLLGDLFQEQYLRISPESAAAAFDWNDNNEPARYWADRVHWAISIDGVRRELSSVATTLELVFADREHWPVVWMLELPALWGEVAMAECLAYLDARMNEHHLPLQQGDKLRLVLGETLKRFSIGQVYNFSWRASRDAAAFYQRGGKTTTHAANTVPGAIQRMAESATANGWETKSYKRDWHVPEAALPALLANVITMLGNDFLGTCPAVGEQFALSVEPILREASTRLDIDREDLLAQLEDTRWSIAELSQYVASTTVSPQPGPKSTTVRAKPRKRNKNRKKRRR